MRALSGVPGLPRTSTGLYEARVGSLMSRFISNPLRSGIE
jgi:hypothetical protein